MSAEYFRPGEIQYIRIPQDIKLPRTVANVKVPRSILVEIPARIGLSVKNMATLAHGKPGGGGIGFAANHFNKTHVTVSGSGDHSIDVICPNARDKILKHHIAVFKECLKKCGNEFEFAVWVYHEEAFNQHCGLGSTSGVALGVLHGINICLGSPFSKEEIRSILAWNYVEEKADSEFILYGYETTMTAVGANGGGIYVIHEETLEVQARNTVVFQDMPVYVYVPDDNPVEIKFSEEACTLAEGAETDAQEHEAAKKKKIFENVLVPELSKADLCNPSVIGTAVFELQASGGKRVEVVKQPSGQRVIAFMESAWDQISDAVIVGMSSIGPSTVVVCKHSSKNVLERVDDIASKTGMKRYLKAL